MIEDNLSDIRVGVLGGGISNEREISLISAAQALKAFKSYNIEAFFIDIETSCQEDIKKQLLSYNIDVAFIALHGEFGEDGKIQTLLEELNIPYTGSSPLASFLAMNKIAAKEIFLKEAIPTPKFFTVESINNIPEYIDLPVVVKPYYSGSSLGVTIVREQSYFIPALKAALALQDKVIVEEYIGGRELTVGILDDKALGVVEIIPKTDFYDFTTKYSDGLVEFKAPAQLDADLYKRIQDIATAAHLSLGCRHFSRVDILLDRESNPYVLEVNSIPGLTSHSLLPLSAKCLGFEFNDLILKMLKLALYGQETAKKS